MSRIAQLEEVSKFIGINILFNEDDINYTFRQICSGLILQKSDGSEPSHYIMFIDENNVEYFCLSLNSKTLWCSHKHVWSIFNKEYGMKYVDIELYIKKMVESCLGIKNVINVRPEYMNI